jgi:3-hydroxyisobutyrate dehydrogenase-like beta-hydroxyacid dehydrogenase
MDVGIVGVGIMGAAMASNLLRAGHRVTGFDIDGSKTEALAGLGLMAAPGPCSMRSPARLISSGTSETAPR